MLSVNTNYGAMTALQSLNAISTEKSGIQSRINTGLKISSATDNGAIWAIAKGITSDLVTTSVSMSRLDQTKSILDVTVFALDSISDLMIDMKEKALAMTDESLSFAQLFAFQEDYSALLDQAQSIASNASFNESNMLDGTTLTLSPVGMSAAGGFDLSSLLETGISRPGDFNGSVSGTQSGTVTGNFTGSVSGTYSGTTYGDFNGSISGTYNGDIYGDLNGSISGTFNGNIYGSINGGVSGTVNGSVHNGSVTPPASVVIGDEHLSAVEYFGATYSGLEEHADIDLSDPFLTSDPMMMSDIKTEFHQHYATAVQSIEQTITGIGNYASKLGTMSKAVQTQTDFLQIKNDVLLKNRGNLVDADLARESANLTAIQTKEQLAVQALSIANRSPTFITQLFG